MRTLVLLRGAPGCGKSYWIKQNNLEQYTLSADDIRLLFQSPVMKVDGGFEISQRNDNRVWGLLFDLLEQRMQRGELTIVDATHSKVSAINRYRKLCQKYRYRVYVVEFNTPFHVCVDRNMQREAYKFVPVDALENMYARFATQPTPNWVTKCTPDDALDKIALKPLDFNKWKRIHHIGDIHGCIEPLREYFDKHGFHDDEFYIFIGDLLDRGVQNQEVLDFMLDLYKKPNVYIIEGNHEQTMRDWAHEEHLRRKQKLSKYVTYKTIDDEYKPEVRQLTRRFGQLAYYEFGGKTVLVTHGGLPGIPSEFVATDEMIHGVGRYEDAERVIGAFNRNESTDKYQVFGHRNNYDLPVENGRCINLCGKPEMGKDMRFAVLDRDGWHYEQITNGTYNAAFVPREFYTSEVAHPSVDELRADKYIREVRQFGNVSSFNFTRDTFYQGHWNTNTTRARGLFINTATGKIVARAYDKFFNIGENSRVSLGELYRTMVFPVVAYLKYNGYLGIIGYDEETDQLITASKSTVHGEHADWFREILSETTDVNAIKEWIKANNRGLVIEVVDPARDPHIIKYGEPFLVLLDAPELTPEGQSLPYDELFDIARQFGMECKELSMTFNTWEDFREWYDEFDKNYEWKWFGVPVEGFVLEDQNGFMVKAKSTYYKFWKQMRGIAQTLAKGRPINTTQLYTPMHNHVFAYMRDEFDRAELAQYNIIDIRDMWLDSNEEVA